MGQKQPGFIFGIFLIAIFGSRFLIEFLKEPQVGFEANMALNMGQLLSIPFIIGGILIWYKGWKKRKV
jgi:prolipoprotein diacylglyceryltransferase